MDKKIVNKDGIEKTSIGDLMADSKVIQPFAEEENDSQNKLLDQHKLLNQQLGQLKQEEQELCRSHTFKK